MTPLERFAGFACASGLVVFSLLAQGCGKQPIMSPPDTVIAPPPPPPPSPPAPPPPPPSVVLTVAGNIATCSGVHDDLTSRLLDSLPGYVFTAGDNAFDNGTAQEYAECFGGSWGRHKSRIYAALGNHEYNTGNADGTFDYFGERAGPRGLGYYSVNVGDWHIIVLNDNAAFVPFGPTDTQTEWLREDLKANTRRCTMAIWHAPLFLSSRTENYTMNRSRQLFWDMLYLAGADVVVNGHQHHYERMAPMDPAGNPDSNGIRQFNVGTGGESTIMPDVAIHPQSQTRSIAFGVLKLTLREHDYDWQFLSIPGETYTDAGSGRCR